ncbi:hypothetical protein BDAP_002296 [Binucleata daphniae]
MLDKKEAKQTIENENTNSNFCDEKLHKNSFSVIEDLQNSKFDDDGTNPPNNNKKINNTKNDLEIKTTEKQIEYDSDNIDCNKDFDFLNNESKTNEDYKFLSLYNKYDDLLSMANNFYAKNEINTCKAVLKKMFVAYPTKPEPFYILGLIFEDEQNIEQAYNCLLNYTLIKKSADMYYKMYDMSMKLNKKLDTIFFIKRLLKIEKNRKLAEQRVNLYKELQNDNKMYYYKMLYSMFEMIEYDGFVYHIKDYIQDCNLVHIKKILWVVYKHLMVKKSDEKYYNEFLDHCFHYKEYTFYKDLTAKHIKKMSQTRKIQYLVASEEVKMKKQELKDEEKYNNDNLEQNNGTNDVMVDEQSESVLCTLNSDMFGEDTLLSKILYKEYDISDFINEDFACFDDTLFVLLEVLETHKKYDILENLLNKFYDKVFDINVMMHNITYKDIENINFDKNVVTNHNKYKFLFYIGVYCKNIKKLELACFIFRKLYSYRENDEAVSAHLREIYKGFQNDKMSKMYDIVEDTVKKRKITPEELVTTRQKYNKIMALLYQNSNNVYEGQYNNSLWQQNETGNTLICDWTGNTQYGTDFEYNNIDINTEYSMQEDAQEYGSVECNAIEHTYDSTQYRYDNIKLEDIAYNAKPNYSRSNKQVYAFLVQSQELLRDFFSNTIFFNKETICKKEQTNLIKSIKKKTKSKQAVRKLNILYKKLHGLEFEEWYELVKLNVLCYIEQNEYKKAIDLVHQFLVGKTREKDSRKYVKYFETIGYLGLRFAVYNNDLMSFIRICKKLYKEPLYIIYFFSNYFPDYVNCLLFKQTQRNLFRVLLRNNFDKSKVYDEQINDKTKYVRDSEQYKEENATNEKGIINNATYEDEHNNMTNNTIDCGEMKNKPKQKSYKTIESDEMTSSKTNEIENKQKHKNMLKDDYAKVSDDVKAEFLLTLMPRYLHKKSLRLLDNLIDNKTMSFKESILVSIMYFNHATSTKESNAAYYLEKGFDILKNLEQKLSLKNDKEKLSICWYNLGRAYTMFGLNGYAEHYYKKSIKAKGSIGLASLYNLCKIYKNNGNAKLYNELINKYYAT